MVEQKKPRAAAKPARPRTSAPRKKAAPSRSEPAAAAAPETPKKKAAPRRKASAKSPKSAKTSKGEAPLSILMVASEAHPFAKTGGLAEVVGSLPLALARMGHQVTIVVPRYRGVEPGEGPGEAVTLAFGDRRQDVEFRRRNLAPGVDAVLIEAPALYDREGLYGVGVEEYGDNAWRFATLSRAALEVARTSGVRPSVIHAHDWQAGLVPVFQKLQFSNDPIVGGVPVVFTIHNLAFQGIFPPAIVPVLGLPWDVMHVDAMEYWGRVSFLKGGINFSERITTVSPTYAREVLDPEHSFGFDGVLRRRQGDLIGILNGIDTQRWNPAADAYLDAAFTANDLSGKQAVKRALLEAAGLPLGDNLSRPVIGLISRLTDQKGFDLVLAAADRLMQFDAAWVMLGSGETRYEDFFRGLAARYPDRVSATIGFDERLAHLIEGGSDVFLMPSRFEPCGLNQMYSLRYGTVPVVRETGGLADTVRDADVHGERGTGFSFQEFQPEAMLGALDRALKAYRNPSRWKEIQQAAMREDHSWDASAREYVKVYRMA